MTSAESLKAALRRICEQVLDGAVPAACQAQEVWSQAAASFAAVTQGSSNPDVPVIQEFLGRTSMEAFELIGREDELRQAVLSARIRPHPFAADSSDRRNT